MKKKYTIILYCILIYNLKKKTEDKIKSSPYYGFSCDKKYGLLKFLLQTKHFKCIGVMITFNFTKRIIEEKKDL